MVSFNRSTLQNKADALKVLRLKTLPQTMAFEIAQTSILIDNEIAKDNTVGTVSLNINVFSVTDLGVFYGENDIITNMANAEDYYQLPELFVY